MTPTAGIAIGFGAALFQSLSYLATRRFVNRFAGDTLYLLVFGHVTMGVVSLAIFPFVLPRNMPGMTTFLPFTLGSVVFYLSGQTSLFLALQQSHPSRVSPLLGLKILILALIGTLVLDDRLSPVKWIAVGMSIVAALLLSRSGNHLRAKSLGWILAACFCYSLSDIYIRKLVMAFQGLPLLHASVLSVTLCYLCSGVAALTVLPFLSRRGDAAMWKAALPFALSWYTGIIMLFACFASIGVVFGNVIQSSRGLISILLGAVIAGTGRIHLEEKVSPGILLSRVGAGILMMGAIALFSVG